MPLPAVLKPSLAHLRVYPTAIFGLLFIMTAMTAAASSELTAPRRFSRSEPSNNPACARSNFSNWWELVSPCLQQIYDNTSTPFAPGCGQQAPSTADASAINLAIDGLISLVNNSVHLTYLAGQMTAEVPPDYRPYCPGNFTNMIHWLRATLSTAPHFMVDVNDFIGVPVTNTLLCYMHTVSGRLFFEHAVINEQVRAIINAWGQYLKSPESLAVLNEQGRAGFSKVGWLKHEQCRTVSVAR